MLTSRLAGGPSAAGFTAVLLGAPTEKVNAPWTGWESAEITCQPTVYVPRPRPGSRATVISCGRLPCAVALLSARWPSGVNTRRLSGLTPTASSNVTLTRAGARARIAPSAGLEETRVACAEAGTAVVSTCAASKTDVDTVTCGLAG